MSDYSELKSAAERIVEVQTSQDVPIGKLFDEFEALAEPEVILALIAESERLERKNANQSESIKQYQDQISGGDLSLGMLIAERDQLKAENEALRKLAPSKEIIWCACGDGHAANSYGAGFMDANNGICANCDAAMGKGEQV